MPKQVNGWDKVKIKIPDIQKGLHSKLGKVSQQLFKLLETAGRSELQLMWRAALSHQLDYNGAIPMPLEQLQTSKELETYEWMLPLLQERVRREKLPDYVKVSKAPRAIAKVPKTKKK